MEKSDVFVLCPRHGTACDIDTCPRFLPEELGLDVAVSE